MMHTISAAPVSVTFPFSCVGRKWVHHADVVACLVDELAAHLLRSGNYLSVLPNYCFVRVHAVAKAAPYEHEINRGVITESHTFGLSLQPVQAGRVLVFKFESTTVDVPAPTDKVSRFASRYITGVPVIATESDVNA